MLELALYVSIGRIQLPAALLGRFGQDFPGRLREHEIQNPLDEFDGQSMNVYPSQKCQYCFSRAMRCDDETPEGYFYRSVTDAYITFILDDLR